MLTVRDLMQQVTHIVAPYTPLQDVLNLMEANDLIQLPVVDGGKLVGIITARDLCLLLNMPNLDAITVEECMTVDPITVTTATPAFRAAKMLSTYKFGALPVLDGERLVGMVTPAHFLQYFAKERAKTSAQSPTLDQSPAAA